MSSFFWQDRWLDGWRVQEITPTLYDRIPAAVKARRTVCEALSRAWPTDVGPNLEPHELDEYNELWDRVHGFALQEGIEDSVRWAWEPSGNFSVRSAYANKFVGRQHYPAAKFIWKSNAPKWCKFFAWLALRNRCWTSDRLARRGLPHQATCPLCDQGTESMEHILIQCVVARETWVAVLTAWGRQDWAPEIGVSLVPWLTVERPGLRHVKDWRMLLLLVCWMIWKHRNAIVFDNATPSMTAVIERILHEGRTWKLAGLFSPDMDELFQRLYRWASRE